MKLIGGYLLDLGCLTEKRLHEALALQKHRDQLIGEVLVEKGYISPSDLSLALALQHKERVEGRGFFASLAAILRLMQLAGLGSARIAYIFVLGLGAGALSFPIIFYLYSGWAWNLIGMIDDVGEVLYITLAAAGLVLISGLLDSVATFSAVSASAKMLESLSKQVHKQVLYKRLNVIDEDYRGKVIATYSQTMNQCINNIEQFFVRSPKAVGALVVFFVLVSAASPAIAVLIFVLSLCTVVVPPLISSRAESHLRKEPGLLGSAMQELEPYFMHFRTISGVLKKRAASQMEKSLLDHHINQAAKWFFWNSSFNAKQLFNILTLASLLIVGGMNALSGEMPLSTLFSLYLAASLILPKFDDIFQAHFNVQAAGYHAEAIRDFISVHVSADTLAADKAVLPIARVEVRCEGIRFEGAEHPVLRDFRYRFEPGGLYLVTGPSGGGKSTLARLIAGIHEHRACSVSLITNQGSSASALGQVSYIGQNHVFLDEADVYENLLYDDARDPALRRAVDELARRFGLTLRDAAEPQPSINQHYSGGEKQRLHIVKGLVARQSVKIFDEPTASLDVQAAAQVKRVLVEVPDDEIRIVISHDHDWPVAAGRKLSILSS